MIRLFVLCGNYKLGVDKDIELRGDIADKVDEESFELREAINREDRERTLESREHVAEEALDNIQLSINILDRLKREGLDIDHAVNLHNLKLIDRGWTFKKMLEVREA